MLILSRVKKADSLNERRIHLLTHIQYPGVRKMTTLDLLAVEFLRMKAPPANSNENRPTVS